MGKGFFVSTFLALLLLSCPYLPTTAVSEVHDVAVIDAEVFPTWTVPIAIDVFINVTVENQGTSYETFNVTIHAGNITVQTLTVANLAPSMNITLTIEWNPFPVRVMIWPPPWPKPAEPMIKNITIWVEVGPVPGEVDLADNVHVDGVLRVIWAPIDYNGDGKIGIFDVAVTARLFGSYEGAPTYDPMLDFNQDGKIDILDVTFPVMNFGVEYA